MWNKLVTNLNYNINFYCAEIKRNKKKTISLITY